MILSKTVTGYKATFGKLTKPAGEATTEDDVTSKVTTDYPSSEAKQPVVKVDFIQFSFSSTLLHIVNSYRTVGKFTMIARCKCYSHIAVWCWLLIRIGHWDNVTYNNFYCHLISSFIWILCNTSSCDLSRWVKGLYLCNSFSSQGLYLQQLLLSPHQ